MNWFRSNIRSCGRLALFALALQMAVSFGHVHRDDLGLPPLAAAGQAQIMAGATEAPAGKADQNHHPAPDHYCPICASIALIGTGAPPLPPVLIVPAAIVGFLVSENPTYSLRPQFTPSFQARGPPIV